MARFKSPFMGSDLRVTRSALMFAFVCFIQIFSNLDLFVSTVDYGYNYRDHPDLLILLAKMSIYVFISISICVFINQQLWHVNPTVCSTPLHLLQIYFNSIPHSTILLSSSNYQYHPDPNRFCLPKC